MPNVLFLIHPAVDRHPLAAASHEWNLESTSIPSDSEVMTWSFLAIRFYQQGGAIFASHQQAMFDASYHQASRVDTLAVSPSSGNLTLWPFFDDCMWRSIFGAEYPPSHGKETASSRMVVEKIRTLYMSRRPLATSGGSHACYHQNRLRPSGPVHTCNMKYRMASIVWRRVGGEEWSSCCSHSGFCT